MSMCDLCSDELGFFDECDSRDCHKRKGGINKMLGWISVKDRLPEDGITVLTYTDRGFAFNHTINVSRNEDKIYIWNGCDKITHWMPLSEPLK